jgi:tape measure domain-containing protein
MPTLADLFVRIRGNQREVRSDVETLRGDLQQVGRMRVAPKIQVPQQALNDLKGFESRLAALGRTRTKLAVDTAAARSDVTTLTNQLQRLQRQRHDVPVALQGKVDEQIRQVKRELEVATRRHNTIPLKVERIDTSMATIRGELDRLRKTVEIPAEVVDPHIGAQVAKIRQQATSSLEAAGTEGGHRFSGAFTRFGPAAVGTAIGGLATGGVLALGAVGAAAGRMGLDVASGNEQARISFTTMLGSAQKADKFLRQLQKFAAQTPFEFPELQTAASSLISAGINASKVIPIMRTLGDVTSGMGTGSEGVQRATVALQQMNAAGRITGEDLNQLRDAGIPVYDLLAKATGKSKAEVVALAQAGKLGRKELGQMMKALETGAGLERFSGLMDKQSHSLAGMASTLKDTLGQGLARAIAPTFPLIKAGLEGMSNAAASMMPVVSRAIKAFVNDVEIVQTVTDSVFRALRHGFEDDTGTGWGNRLVYAAEAVRNGFLLVSHAVGPFLRSEIMPRLKGIGTAFQGLWRTVQPIAMQIGAAIQSAFGGGGGGKALGALKDYVLTVLNLIKVGIETTTRVISFIWQHWGSNITTVVKTSFGLALTVLTDALKSLAGVLKFFTALMQGDWSGAWAGLKQSMDAQLHGIVAIATGIWKILRVTTIAALGALWKEVVTAFGRAWQSLTDSFNQVRAAVGGALSQVGRTVSGAFAGMQAAVVGTLTRLWGSITGVLTGIGRSISGALTSIGRTISALMQPWIEVAKIVFTAITTIIILALGAVKAVVTASWRFVFNNIIRPVWNQITGQFNRASAIVRGAWNAMWGAVKNTARAAWNWVYGNVIAPVWARIRAAFNLGSVVLRAAWNVMWAVVKNTVRAAWNWVHTTIVAVWNRIRATYNAGSAALRAIWNAMWTAVKNTVRAAWNWVHNNVIAPVFGRIRGTFSAGSSSVRGTWSGLFTSVKNTARSGIDWAYSHINSVLGRIKGAFNSAKGYIARVWGGVRSAVSGPINWVKDHVYNSPLVPVWNRVAGLVGAKRLQPFRAGGITRAANDAIYGVRPNYTPGRDTHAIEVGGGEAIMRPEWTAAAGEAYVNAANQASRTGGIKRAREFIATVGLPGERFARGGIVGWLSRTFGGAINAVKNIASRVKDWALGGLRSAAGAALGPVRSAINARLHGTGVADTMRAVANKAIDLVLDKIKSSEDSAAATGVGSNRRMSWKGGTFTERFVNTLKAAEMRARAGFSIFQGGFRPATSYSGTSHQGDAVDLAPITAAVVRALRLSGVAAWRRGPKQGFTPHIHGVPLPGFGFAAGSGIWQAQNYLAGGDGLGGRDYEARVPRPTAVSGGASVSGGVKSVAQQLLRLHGWEAQFPSLDYIVNHESGWNVRARNPSSGAYGLGQALPASKMRPFGADYLTSANTQLRWMMSYIGSRYGNPNNAAAFWRAHHWYDKGGIVPLADGAVVRGGRGGVLATIGEGKRDELVTPLPRGWQQARPATDPALTRLAAAMEAGRTGPAFHFTTYNPISEPESVTTNKALQRVAALGLV